MDSTSTARELLRGIVWERERLNRGLPLGARRCEELMIAVKTVHLKQAGEANRYCLDTCEMTAENGAFGGCFPHPNNVDLAALDVGSSRQPQQLGRKA